MGYLVDVVGCIAKQKTQLLQFFEDGFWRDGLPLVVGNSHVLYQSGGLHALRFGAFLKLRVFGGGESDRHAVGSGGVRLVVELAGA